ncbi:MAG: hypothetical protein PHD43_16450 [Methylococcales bacterium]|nr:hypothetical protein [Methylococcales bacterium]
MNSIKSWIHLLKEDIYVFRLVFGPGIGKYFYYPAFRAIFIFRLSQLFYKCRITQPIAYLLTNINDFIHGIWIGPKVKVGKGLLLSHPRGIILNPDTVIGEYCSILHQVTFGGENIIVGNNVEILAGAKIINDKLKNKKLIIGKGAVLAAGTVVLNDVPDNAVMVGVPGKVAKYRDINDNWLNYRLQKNSN